MSGTVNKVILVCNLTRDPESRSFQNGGKVVELRVATNESWKDKSTGEKREKAEFHTVKVFNEGLATVAEKYLRKGSKVYIEGALTTRKWQDQQGQDRYSTEVVLQGFNSVLTMLDGAKSNGSEGSNMERPAYGSGSRGGGGQQSGGQTGGFADDLDSDVPFISWDDSLGRRVM